MGTAFVPCVSLTIDIDTDRVKLSWLYWQVVFQASDFLTVALLVGLEGLLSADNAMVLAVLVLGLPKAEQRKALRYGIVGAFAFRAVATLLAVYLIHLAVIKILGAGYLLYLVF